MTPVPASGHPVTLVARPPLPEHGWSTTHGPAAPFEELPRFARTNLLLRFELHMVTELLIVAGILGVVAFLAGTPFWTAALLLILATPVLPVLAFQELMRRQLGPYRLRVVDVTTATALTRDEAPQAFLRKVEHGLMWRGLVALVLVATRVAVYFLVIAAMIQALKLASPDPMNGSWLWFALLLPYMLVAETTMARWLLASALRTKTPTHCLRFVA